MPTYLPSDVHLWSATPHFHTIRGKEQAGRTAGLGDPILGRREGLSHLRGPRGLSPVRAAKGNEASKETLGPERGVGLEI